MNAERSSAARRAALDLEQVVAHAGSHSGFAVGPVEDLYCRRGSCSIIRARSISSANRPMTRLRLSLRRPRQRGRAHASPPVPAPLFVATASDAWPRMLLTISAARTANSSKRSGRRARNIERRSAPAVEHEPGRLEGDRGSGGLGGDFCFLRIGTSRCRAPHASAPTIGEPLWSGDRRADQRQHHPMRGALASTRRQPRSSSCRLGGHGGLFCSPPPGPVGSSRSTSDPQSCPRRARSALMYSTASFSRCPGTRSDPDNVCLRHSSFLRGCSCSVSGAESGRSRRARAAAAARAEGASKRVPLSPVSCLPLRLISVKSTTRCSFDIKVLMSAYSSADYV